jgi:hypothetical protein
LVWVAAHLSKQDCELACDEAALRLLDENERLDYGRTLLGLVTVKGDPKHYFSMATTMISGKRDLKQRILAISKKPRVMISVCVLVVFAVVFGFIATSTAKNERTSAGETEDTQTEETVVPTDITDDIQNLETVGEDHTFYNEYFSEESFTVRQTFSAKLMADTDASENSSKSDTVEVYTGYWEEEAAAQEDTGIVLVSDASGANEPYSIEASLSRAGWNSIYLVTVDGKDYIMELHLENRGDTGEYSYVIYNFEEQVGSSLAASVLEGASFRFFNKSFNDESFAKWGERMDYYLKDATLLLSTQDDELRVGPDNDYDRYNSQILLDELKRNLAEFEE